MANYFDEGERIFYIDDDIYGVYECVNPVMEKGEPYHKRDNILVPVKNLDALIQEGFHHAHENKCNNWGIFAAFNPYFMKPTTSNSEDYTSTYLSYIIGFMTGVINNRKAEIRTIDDKEDYERSIKYYLKDGGVLRFNNVTCRTNCYKEPGGMQVERTKKRIHDSAVYLTKKYPNLCTLNTGKKSGFTEVRLKDKRETKKIDLSKQSSCGVRSKKMRKCSKKPSTLKKIPISKLPIKKC